MTRIQTHDGRSLSLIPGLDLRDSVGHGCTCLVLWSCTDHQDPWFLSTTRTFLVSKTRTVMNEWSELIGQETGLRWGRLVTTPGNHLHQNLVDSLKDDWTVFSLNNVAVSWWTGAFTASFKANCFPTTFHLNLKRFPHHTHPDRN